MKEEVKEVIERFELIPEKARVVVSVSGGPDSVALLYVLNQVKADLNIYLHVAHLNHGFRGQTAEEDAEFVKELAKKLNISFTIEQWNVKRYVEEKGISAQQGARELRYRFLAGVARKVNADKIALGHNKDDQVETFLLRLLRGSGLEGLSGMPIKRPLSNTVDYYNKRIDIIRPLLYVSRNQIENYLKALKQEYKIDPTNKKTIYLRNKVRLELIPQLEAITPNFKHILFDTTEFLAHDNHYLKLKSEELFEKVKVEVNENKGYVCLDYNLLKKEHKALKTRVLAKSFKIASDNEEIGKKHIYFIEEMLANKRRGPLILPAKTRVYLKRGFLYFDSSKGKPTNFYIENYNVSLKIPGKTYWKPMKCSIKAEIKKPQKNEIYQKNPLEAFLDYDKLGNEIRIRTREKGDRFKPFGMGKEKKLKDFFIDNKLPLELRDKLPVVVSGGKIVWVAPYRINEDFKVTSWTKRVLHLKILREDNHG